MQSIDYLLEISWICHITWTLVGFLLTVFPQISIAFCHAKMLPCQIFKFIRNYWSGWIYYVLFVWIARCIFALENMEYAFLGLTWQLACTMLLSAQRFVSHASKVLKMILGICLYFERDMYYLCVEDFHYTYIVCGTPWHH